MKNTETLRISGARVENWTKYLSTTSQKGYRLTQCPVLTEVITAVLLRTQVFWDVTPCRLVVTNVMLEGSAFVLGMKQLKSRPRRLLDPKDKGITILWNIGDKLFTSRRGLISLTNLIFNPFWHVTISISSTQSAAFTFKTIRNVIKVHFVNKMQNSL